MKPARTARTAARAQGARAAFDEALRDVGESIATFKADPPDTDFQRGYLAALRRLQGEIKRLRGEVAS
ncbi:DUF3209 family protein [Roseococcus sp. SDR]|uniref:DUF3209 family protein n=1 Tax=Roseococcus sp. SDR TaxID=2835532 RepID=UPI001BCEFDFF|nr:DUF3209 family protein [Roseococcus sp. SDR]MBS7790278.1 DUF3209 family protein [Roseococcus sp. SDR]MBV1845592.1 DUF3209 family protein [Roseococcus sp. SDR]